MRARRASGFTLIELLVVIAIIGILASIILASLSTAQGKGRDARRISDIKELQLALELYYDANSSYPTTPLNNSVNAAAFSTALVSSGYISQIPTDPSGGSDYYGYEGLTSAGSNCITAGSCTDYVLAAQLEGGNDALSSGNTGNYSFKVNGTTVNCSTTQYLFCVTGQ